MIYYATYYSTKGSCRVANFAGEDKIDYICDVLNRLGEDVTLLSNAKTTQKKFCKTEVVCFSEKRKLIMFSSLPRINLAIHALDVLWGFLQLAFFILIHVNKNDHVIVYHSLGYRNLWSFLRKIKKFHYILEVEEIFQYFIASKSSFKKRENVVFNAPDAFVFSNYFLNEKINEKKVPYAIVNGVYKMNELLIKNEGVSQKIKVVYAGSFEKQKGVDLIINAAHFLPSNYELHVIGFGTKEDVNRVVNCIFEVNAKSKADVFYDGVYKGDEYFRFLQSCDIGVCIQDADDDFNKYEYPSKIFSYLSNGLQVVVNELVQVKKSEVFPYLHIAKSINPSDIADAIRNCEKNFIDANEIMRKLDESFSLNLKKILRS